MAIITISRGTFGGGKAVAQAVAERLDYNCISREIIVGEAARAFDMPEKALNDSILKAPGPLGLKTNRIISNVRFLRAALIEKGRDNKMVYHGYGGHLLLKGMPNLLTVKVVAGMDYRISHAMENEGFTKEEALAHIIEMDKNRDHWARAVWGVEQADNTCFDLMVNLDQISVEGAADVIVRAAREPAFQETEAHRQKLEDELIVSRIWARIIKNKPTRFVQIHLYANKGQVTITGDLGSNKLKEAVVNIARETQGVQKVENQLNIGSSWLW
ncbi:MAG: cytidylate kinase family protein [Desulfobacter sp.]|nr:MAG: cytidylate kinase family protein [Desulfobacter sp.]